MRNNYFLILGFLFFSLLGLINLIFTPVSAFYLELFFTELFILFAIFLIFIFYNESKWMGKSSFLFFSLFIINLCYIRSMIGFNLLIGVLGVLCILALFLSFSYFENKKEEVEKVISEEPVFEPDETLFVEDIKQKSLGIFVSSKNSSVFHVPACAFAKRIKQEDKDWFNNKAQATRKKHRAHSCVK